MKYLISVDLEGISGIANWEDMKANPKRAEELMTGDVNEIIAGILEADPDAGEILVVDSHSRGINIDYPALHERASLVRGFPRPYYMMTGIDSGFDMVFLVGYHSKTGERTGGMDHTFSSGVIFSVQIDGMELGEFDINAGLAASYGVPVVFTSGDRNYIESVMNLGLGIECVVTKESFARFAAKLLPLKSVRKALRESARRAVERGKGDYNLRRFAEPIRARVTALTTSKADVIEHLPCIRRVDGRTFEVETSSFRDFYLLFNAMIMLGWTVDR